MFKPTNINSPKQIFASLTEMQTFLEAHYTSDNPKAVVERGNYLESYMALSGKLLADAQYHYNDLLESSIIIALKNAMEQKLSAMTLNKYIEGLTKDFKYLVTWADRVNRSATHQLDMVRTIISKLKSEMQQYGAR